MAHKYRDIRPLKKKKETSPYFTATVATKRKKNTAKKKEPSFPGVSPAEHSPSDKRHPLNMT